MGLGQKTRPRGQVLGQDRETTGGPLDKAHGCLGLSFLSVMGEISFLFFSSVNILNSKLPKGCHVEERVHVFCVTSERRLLPVSRDSESVK